MTCEEAINKLEYLIISPVGREEIDETCYEVMKYLAAQEPRVMALEEALNSLVIEYRNGKLQEVGKLIFTTGKLYGNIWRVWDKMPTDEQREKEPWDGAER